MAFRCMGIIPMSYFDILPGATQCPGLRNGSRERRRIAMALVRNRDSAGTCPPDEPVRSETLLLCSDVLAVAACPANTRRANERGPLDAAIERAKRRRRSAHSAPLPL